MILVKLFEVIKIILFMEYNIYIQNTQVWYLVKFVKNTESRIRSLN